MPAPERPQDPKHAVVRSTGDQRVSDDERQAVVEQLRLSAGEGRLDMDEFGERVEQALAARTATELQAVLHDLPVVQPQHVVVARKRRRLQALFGSYGVTCAFLIAIWAISGMGYFWPIWVIVPWGFAIVLGALKRQ